MDFKMTKVILFLLGAIPLLLACGSRSSNKKKTSPTTTPTRTTSRTPANYYPSDVYWGSWKEPQNSAGYKWKEAWGRKNDTENTTDSDEWRGLGSGWPPMWKGIGPGLSGVPPPPWSYVEKAYDKPQFCFYPPRSGDCSNNTNRWVYDPAKAKCVSFSYSGCGGNANNFKEKDVCEATCNKTAISGCEDEPGVDFEAKVSQLFQV